jgi:acyl-CoA synthetase (AMP-forming)/AMP-acid ligase II
VIAHDAAVVAEYRANGWWGDATVDDLFAAIVAAHPGRLALVDAPNRVDFTNGEPARLTYSELDRAVSAVAGRMALAGVGYDDVVVYQLPNTVEAVIMLLACARIGVICSPVLPQFDENELRPILATLKPRLFVTVSRYRRRDLSEAVQAVCDGTDCTVVVLDQPAHADWLSPAAGGAEALARVQAAGRPSADDVFTVCWTSGTEGEPKGAMRSHNNWRWTGRIMVETALLQPGDVILNSRPLVNMAAIGGSVMSWLMCAGTLVMHPPLDIPLALRQIRDERVQATFMPPAFFLSLLNDPELAAGSDISSLRVMGTGSATIPSWAIERMETDHGVEIVNFFGANEGTSLLSSPREMPDASHRGSYFPRLGSRGFDWPSVPLAPQIQARLIDLSTGEEIDEPGRPGELRMRSPSIFAGYFGRADLTRNAFDADGYLRTGDLFEIAGEGELGRYYRYVGRSKDIIVRGGLKIAPAELDELLSRHPLLKEAAAFGFEDARLGEKVGVAAVPRQPGTVSLQDIIQYLRDQKVAVFKLPERLMLLDALPRNAMQKVLRRELSRQANESEAA